MTRFHNACGPKECACPFTSLSLYIYLFLHLTVDLAGCLSDARRRMERGRIEAGGGSRAKKAFSACKMPRPLEWNTRINPDGGSGPRESRSAETAGAPPPRPFHYNAQINSAPPQPPLPTPPHEITEGEANRIPEVA